MAVLTAGFATDKGDELALADDTGTRTWAELDERVNRLIHSFRAAGIGAGDTIAVVSGNCNEWFEIAFACANARHRVRAGQLAPRRARDRLHPRATPVRRPSWSATTSSTRSTKALADERSRGVELALVIGAPTGRPVPELRRLRRRRVARRARGPELRRPDVLHAAARPGNPKGVRGSLTNMPERRRPGDLAADRCRLRRA